MTRPQGEEPPSSSASGAAERPAQRIAVTIQADAERARRAAQQLATAAGLDRTAAACVLVATMELATNLVRYGQHGVIVLRLTTGAQGTGVCIESQDEGPGIADVTRALLDGFSTGGGLGSGLPAVRRLMDGFALTTSPRGTRVVACKWPTRRSG